MIRYLTFALAALVITAAPAAAEMELSLYIGWQENQDSTVSGVLPGGAPFGRDIGWDADSFDNPPYYGGRAIWWTQGDFGFGVEATHGKAAASAADMAALGLTRLEFTNGQNILTLNVMKRWPGLIKGSRLTPYLGAGAGIAIPHYEVQVAGAPNRNFDYEITGPALRGIAGVKYGINARWAVFGEYQITWSDNEESIDPNVLVPGQTPGRLNTEITSHAVNVGVSYSF